MNIKDVRLDKGVKAEDLAKLLGISLQAYYKYERNETEPNITSLIKLEIFFNVSIDHLLGRDFATAKDSFDNEIMDVVSKLDITEKSRVLGYAKGRLEAQKEMKDFKIRSGYRG